MSMQSEYSTAGLKTELTLGLPGGGGCELAGSKRRFNDTVVGANLGDEASAYSTTKPSPPKAQVVGWPPVRPFRRNMMKRSKYVKVAVDGAPFLRKVDLEVYSSYEDLLAALENMFTCFTIRNVLNERKIMDPSNGTEYLPSYEDKDGDWMLVGDVPWKMFVESCKRLRLMKSSEANDLAPRACSSESSTS